MLTSNQDAHSASSSGTSAFDTKTGRLVDGYGNAVSAATGHYAGQYQVQNTISYEENPFAL